MRLLVISVTAVLMVMFTLLTARMWGNGQTFVPYQHAFFDFLATPQKIIKFKSFEDLKKAPANQALFVDLLVSRDGVFAVNFNPQLATLQGHDSTQWPDAVVPFKDFLPYLDNRCVILNIVDNLGGIHSHVQKLFGEHKVKESSCLALTSETESVVKATKEILPRFIYGSSRAEVMTMLSMQSMYILPAFRVRSDLVISPLKSRNKVVIVNEDLVTETHRQFKKFAIGPLESEADIEFAQKMNPDALIIVQ